MLSARQRLAEAVSALHTVKRKIEEIIPKRSFAIVQKVLDNKAKMTAIEKVEMRRKEMATFARGLLTETGFRQEKADLMLRSQWKKHYERTIIAQNELRKRLETKERLTWARKMKMMAEVYTLFAAQPVLEGFKLVSSPLPALERDVEISTALGYCCLILEFLSTYLSIPLLYPVKFQGSRSSVLSEGREMPLYALGRHTDKQKMEQSMRLLLQDLIQVLRHISYSGSFEVSQSMVLLMEQLKRNSSRD